MNGNLLGQNSNAWKGGWTVTKHGYVQVYARGNPSSNHRGYIFEHILIAERILGKRLPDGATVHHVNRNPADNRPGNLVICQDNSYHQLLHKRARAYEAVGDPSALRCGLCGCYDNQPDMYVDKQGYAKHKACLSARAKKLVRKRLGLAENSPIPKKAIKKLCVECGIEFKSYPSTRQLFCSQFCKNKYQIGKQRNHSLKKEGGHE